MNDNGAVLSSDQPAAKLVAAFESIMADLGYTRSEGSADVEVRIWTAGEAACIGVVLAKSLAMALARKLAVRLRSPVRIFTAGLIERSSGYDCVLDDLTVGADGTRSVGRWGTDTTSTYGQNWDEVCDGKPHFAVSALLQMAVDDVLPESTRSVHALRAPPSLGGKRIDEIAGQIRFADRAQLTTMAGRECVRITNEGTTVTSFLEAEEAAALRPLIRQGP